MQTIKKEENCHGGIFTSHEQNLLFLWVELPFISSHRRNLLFLLTELYFYWLHLQGDFFSSLVPP